MFTFCTARILNLRFLVGNSRVFESNRGSWCELMRVRTFSCEIVRSEPTADIVTLSSRVRIRPGAEVLSFLWITSQHAPLYCVGPCPQRPGTSRSHGVRNWLRCRSRLYVAELRENPISGTTLRQRVHVSGRRFLWTGECTERRRVRLITIEGDGIQHQTYPRVNAGHATLRKPVRP